MDKIVTTTHLETLKALKAAIRAKSTTHVYVNPRMGCLDLWMRVTKKQALDMLSMVAKDATAEDCEMGTGAFGTVNNFGEVYIG